jgi:3-hydroxyisobutyrate dehydrogenase-like beta-hydroxyacid dehydrogenase
MLNYRQAGHNVTVLVRSSNKATELLKNEVRVVEG